MPGSTKDDEDQDYAIELAPISEANHPTMELQTSDLVNMAQSGTARAKPHKVIQVSGGADIALEPGWSHGDAPLSKVVIADTPSVVVEPLLVAPRPTTPRAVAAPPVEPASAPPRSGGWLVAVVYVLAAVSLALALYERFG